MKPTVLLVDDNEEILEFIEDVLQFEYRILKSTSAIEMLKILESESVQLIISDVMMPEMDGFELCKQLKTDLDYCHIPVILLTAKSSITSKIEGLELGADAYIEKPFSPRHLKAQIGSLISNRIMMKEYFANSPLIHIKSMANTKADEIFLEKLNNIILQNLEETEFDSEHLAELLNMSKPTLYRKIRSISNLTLNELINLARLKKAAALLAERDYKIFEVSNMIGFSSPNHFNRIFFKQFKMSPTEFIKGLKK